MISTSAWPPVDEPVKPTARIAGWATRTTPACTPWTSASVPSGAACRRSASLITSKHSCEVRGWEPCAFTTTGAPRGQRRRGVTAGHGERQREVAGAEHRHRAERHEHPPQVRPGPHRRVTGVVDGGLDVAALIENLGEQPQLVARAGELAAQPGGAQRGLPV